MIKYTTITLLAATSGFLFENPTFVLLLTVLSPSRHTWLQVLLLLLLEVFLRICIKFGLLPFLIEIQTLRKFRSLFLKASIIWLDVFND